jgi:Flp pilus assembly pilin Flp
VKNRRVRLTSIARCGIMCPPILLFPLTLGTDIGWRDKMSEFMRRMWAEEAGQDIAEYAVMLAVILVLVVGTIRLVGSNANNVFSNVASSIQ